tara:strand:+ start:1395 stop:1502 length:108 start_codon:yes stop_codon:yes gene_type:complete
MKFLKRRDYKGFLGNFYELFDLKKGSIKFDYSTKK